MRSVCRMELNYPRLRTNGHLGRFRAATPQEIDNAFEASYMPVPESGCWLWIGDATKSGYGVMWGRQYAHRYSYAKFRGSIPTGMHVLHRCDVPCCVNPDHLFLGTQIDNNNDKMTKGRARGGSMKGESHPGHKLVADQVLEIRRLVAVGNTQTGVAKKFGITQGQVWQIISRRHWKHV